jgi:hypothetical protein
LVSDGGTGLIGQDEAGTDPDSRGAEHQSSSDRSTVVQTTGCDDLHGLASQRALLALDQLGNGGDEDSGGDVTGVTATLTTLGADNINANIKGLLDVLGVADHVHAEDAGTVELIDNSLGGHTDGGDEKASLLLDDNIDELTELALGVIVAICRNKTRLARCPQMRKYRSDREFLLGLAGTAANLGKEKVDTEGSVLVVQVALELGDLFAEHLGGVTNTTNHSETTGVGDSGSQLGPRSHVHACQQDGVVDLKQIGDRGTDLLCSVVINIDVEVMHVEPSAAKEWIT